MKNIFTKIFIILVTFSFWNCAEDSTEITYTEARNHAEQFPKEEKAIEEFLGNYSPKITYNSNGDVTKIEILKSDDPLAAGLPSFSSFYHQGNNLTYTNDYSRVGIKEDINENNPSTFSFGTYPRLIKKDFYYQGTTYSYWYFMVKPGATTKIPYGYTTATSARPCELDGVVVDYKGYVLKDTTHTSGLTHMLRAKAFDESNYPIEFRLSGVIKGWSRIMPKFGSADTRTVAGDGSVNYQNYGSGIMILPSGMGYYNSSSVAIPAYSPLVFTFNIYDVKRYDHDQDGIMSYREDKKKKISDNPLVFDEADGYFYAGNTQFPSLNDDNDNDGTSDCFDYDDDGDGLITYREVLNQLTGLPFLDSEFEQLSIISDNTNCFYTPPTPSEPKASYLVKSKKRNVIIKNGSYEVKCINNP